jgi:hypothetical protein
LVEEGRILCFLGGKLKVGLLYLVLAPECQGRIAGFFGFLPVFSGIWDMYLGAESDMLWDRALQSQSLVVLMHIGRKRD